MDFPKAVEKELDVKLNYLSEINEKSLENYPGPKDVRKVFRSMKKMGDQFYPGDLPAILMREAGLSETQAKWHVFEAYHWYVFEPAG